MMLRAHKTCNIFVGNTDDWADAAIRDEPRLNSKDCQSSHRLVGERLDTCVTFPHSLVPIFVIWESMG